MLPFIQYREHLQIFTIGNAYEKLHHPDELILTIKFKEIANKEMFDIILLHVENLQNVKTLKMKEIENNFQSKCGISYINFTCKINGQLHKDLLKYNFIETTRNS